MIQKTGKSLLFFRILEIFDNMDFFYFPNRFVLQSNKLLIYNPFIVNICKCCPVSNLQPLSFALSPGIFSIGHLFLSRFNSNHATGSLATKNQFHR